jgi:hypothetical protein
MRPIIIMGIAVLVGIILFLVTETVKLSRYAKRSYISACYTGGGESEWGERDVAYKFTAPDACVLEFGGGAGSVSEVIQRVLLNPTDHVVVQPDDSGAMFGGLAQLRKNRAACQSEYVIIDHVLARGEGASLIAGVSKPFNLIVADCEGCLVNEYEKNPDLFDAVKMIQVERDDSGSYSELFKRLNMRMVYSGPHTGCLTVEVWTRA